MSELRQIWKSVRIRDVVSPVETVDPKKTPQKLFKYVDIGSIDNQTQSICHPKIILGRDAPSRARRRIQAGDVLFSTVRTYLKNIAIVPNDLDGSVTSTGIAVLRPRDVVATEFLFNWTRSADFLAQVGKAMDGTMYPAVTDRDVLDQYMPLPPISEQRRIAAKLGGLFKHSENAREQLARIPKLVERYKQATLSAAFDGVLTNEDRGKWKSVPLGETIERIDSGKNIRCEERPPIARERGIVKVSSVSWGTFDPLASKTPSGTTHLNPSTLIVPGDFLISRANTLELLSIA